jgi:hypothetical protein
MTFDSVRNRVLLFGGSDAMGVAANDAWEWDGASWQQISEAGMGSAPRMAAMTFDTRRGVAVMFGADGANAFTWEWNGSVWTDKSSRASPTSREGAPIAFDESLARTLLVQGGGNIGPATWTWDGTSWLEVGMPAPNQYDYAGMAYDRARGRTVHFGGATPDGVPSADTWEYDGVAWTDRSVVPSPPPRVSFGMAYVDTLQSVVVFGGEGASVGGNENWYDDLWSWDGTTWREQL